MSREHWLLPEAPYASFKDYLAAVGSSAVEKAWDTPIEELIAELRRAGLRGRGGAGFPTGTKWATVAHHACPNRYVVVNAAEGEPGTFKDRMLIRANPYAVVEGILIAAHVVKARAVYIAVKRSSTRELEALRRAIDEMKALVRGVMVSCVEGPEEYLFGEEKALLNVIEGGEPMPREAHDPPYEVGLHATPGSPNPVLVNNPQTLAHVSTIVRHGSGSFRRMGTGDTPGTLLVTLSGDVARPGVYEVEAGTPLRQVVERHGGGARPGRTLRAALVGVSAPPLPAERFDTPLDFGSMSHAGAGLGTAGFVLVDDATSIPRVAQGIARFLYVESCNQCSACKAGLRIASRAIDELFDPALATPDDPERALFGAASAPQGNRCYLPVQGSLVLPALLRRYKAEFDAQVEHADRPTAPWPVPKLVDYDPPEHRFTIDEDQARKRPDWTYAQPEGPEPRPLPPPARGALAVRIPQDLATRLQMIADESGREIDRQVEAALREWLARQGEHS